MDPFLASPAFTLPSPSYIPTFFTRHPISRNSTMDDLEVPSSQELPRTPLVAPGTQQVTTRGFSPIELGAVWLRVAGQLG